MKSEYPPIKRNPRWDKEAPSDAGIRLSRANEAQTKSGSGRRVDKRKKPDRRVKVTVKDRALLEEMADRLGISKSAVLNLGLHALAEKHGVR